MSQSRKQGVTLKVQQPVQLEAGITLPTGTYRGLMKQIGMHYMGQLAWLDPEYSIELTAAQLTSMGAQGAENFISVDYDVTRFVKAGQIIVA